MTKFRKANRDPFADTKSGRERRTIRRARIAAKFAYIDATN